jgi:hypothetical protein
MSNSLIAYKKYRNHKAVSWSDLKVLLESPVRYVKYKIEGDTTARKVSTGFLIGDLVDCLVYNEDELWEQFVLQKDNVEKPKSPNQEKFVALMIKKEGNAITWYKACYAESSWGKMSELELKEKATELVDKYSQWVLVERMKQKGLEVITEVELNIARGMVESLKKNKLINRLLFETGKWDVANDQFPIVGNLEMDGWGGSIFAKCLLDSIRVSFGSKTVYVIDLKTTRRSFGDFHYDYFQFKYHGQLVFYGMMAIKWLIAKGYIEESKVDEWKIRLISVVVQNVPYYEAFPYEMTEETMDKGIALVNKAATKYIYHDNTDEWTVPMEAKQNKGFIPI